MPRTPRSLSFALFADIGKNEGFSYHLGLPESSFLWNMKGYRGFTAAGNSERMARELWKLDE
jgi:hypothetical protein